MKIKSAMDLIEFAKRRGYTVGRRFPGVYYFGSANGEYYQESEFKGGWHQFVKHMILVLGEEKHSGGNK